MATKKQPSRLTKALLETADDMHRSGVIGTAARDKITMRHLGQLAEPVVEPMSGAESVGYEKRRI
jgi:putative transcriptional regulator